jgi:uncharacterized membrane protein
MWSVYLMAFLYALAGVNHFYNPKFYLAIMPSFIPSPDFTHKLAGVIQLLLAAGLIYAPTRLWAAYGVIAMLVVFQLFIHLVHFWDTPKGMDGKYWMVFVRFALQFVLIWWAWKVGQMQGY